MQSNIPLKWLLPVSGILIIAAVSITLFLNQVSEHQTSESVIDIVVPTEAIPSIVPPIQVISGLPIRLTIPNIHVDAAVEDLGLTALGAMDVPKGPADVAWFDLGPRPGEVGSAVIAGHEGWKDGIPAVFDNLSQLQKGEKIYVEGETGTTTTFVVTDVRTFGENEDASDVFLSNDGLAHLNLITCEGVWNAAKQSYSNRLVVFADELISTSSPQQL